MQSRERVDKVERRLAKKRDGWQSREKVGKVPRKKVGKKIEGW